VLGFDCTRSEVSGSRFWGWARDRFGSAEHFFAAGFVHNYCPLVFMADSGRNITPDKLPRGERDALYALCDRLLRIVIESLRPRELVAVGAFAEQRLVPLAAALGLGLRRIPHPSPASPVANKGWAEAVDAVLADLLPSP
jgi:single-strand selective monofunctional uracil DNA glycosylase